MCVKREPIRSIASMSVAPSYLKLPEASVPAADVEGVAGGTAGAEASFLFLRAALLLARVRCRSSRSAMACVCWAWKAWYAGSFWYDAWDEACPPPGA